jgi:hypothetical protein
MLILNVLSGFAVRLATRHLEHAVHHLVFEASNEDTQDPFFGRGISHRRRCGDLFVHRGCLLLSRNR